MLKDDLNKKCSDVYISDTIFERDFAEYRREKVETFMNTLLKTTAKAVIDTKHVEKASRLIPLGDCQNVSKVFNAYLTVHHSEKGKKYD